MAKNDPSLSTIRVINLKDAQEKDKIWGLIIKSIKGKNSVHHINYCLIDNILCSIHSDNIRV